MISGGCADLLTNTPGDTYSDTSAYQSLADLVAALNHLYTFLPRPGLNPKQPVTFGLLTYMWTNDALRRNTNGMTFGADLSWVSSDPHVTIFYRYREIRDINEFIVRVSNAEPEDPELVARMEKEIGRASGRERGCKYVE